MAQINPQWLEENKKKNVFVVYGHNKEITKEVLSFLESIGLIPLLLEDLPNIGQTIIEKLEYYSQYVSYAIIVMTADDQCTEKDKARAIERSIDPSEERLLASMAPYNEGFERALEVLRRGYNRRARQNVVFEFGYFVAKLGRTHVSALHERGVELPSDINGLVYISLDEDWKRRLKQEFAMLGIEFKS
jgi:Predicted nucleotide-binding protein containing TIR -like domain